jgi:hypothetical protein
LNPKPVIIATCCAILFVVTVYFGGQHLLEQGRIEAPTSSAISSKKVLTPHKASVPRTELHEDDQHLNDQPAKTTSGLGASSGTVMSENEQNTDRAPISEKTEAVDVPVSPYGFGPYPELPPGYPKDYWDRRMSKEHELLARVRIKLNVEGASMQNGLVYPNFPDTIYVEWDWNGNERYISRIMGHPDAKRAIRNTFPPSPLTEKDIPANIKMFTLPNGGIDPYEFLNLKKE